MLFSTMMSFPDEYSYRVWPLKLDKGITENVMLLRGVMSFTLCHNMSRKGSNSWGPAWCCSDANSSCLQNVSGDDEAVAGWMLWEREHRQNF